MQRRYPDIDVEYVPLAMMRGAWVSSESMILIDQDMHRVMRRAALAHEIAHIDLGHRTHLEGRMGRRAERDADRLADRRLLGSISDIAEAVATYAGDNSAIADALDVPVEVLIRRVETMHPRDRARIEARVART